MRLSLAIAWRSFLGSSPMQYRYRILVRLVSFILCSSCISSVSAGTTAAELAKSDLPDRMAWFTHDRFGLFIHWGLYAELGGVWKGQKVGGYAEWIQARAEIPLEEYTALAQQFRPERYDPDAWVKAARDAGMRYVVITTKHHDGFCLWPSQLTEYDIEDATPYTRDIIGELAAACKKHGLKFGTYYSIIDWHHPSQEPNRAEEGSWRRYGHCLMKEGRKEEYVAYMKGQIKELIETYDTDILWFDGDWNRWWTLEDGEELYRYIRRLKPDIIVNNRVSKRNKFKYDFGTPENNTPGGALDHYWEACWTMNHTWGYSTHDHKWKSDRVLIQKLVDIASKGGNLLLNVGPKPDGTIQEEAYRGLAAMGAWLDVNGEGIYGTDYVPVSAPVGTRVTGKADNTLFVHVFSPFEAQEVILPLKTASASAVTLAGGRPVPVTVTPEALELDIRHIKRDPAVTTLKVALPEGYRVVAPPLVPLRDGDILLKASDAEIVGEGPLRLEPDIHALGHWSALQQGARWKREVVVSGRFELLAVYALRSRSGAAVVTADLSSGQSVRAHLKPTGGWAKFQEVSLGEIQLTAMQPETFTISGKDAPAGTKSLMNLRGIILRPIP